MTKRDKTFHEAHADLIVRYMKSSKDPIDGSGEIITVLAEALGKSIGLSGLGDADKTSELLEGAIQFVTETAVEYQALGSIAGVAQLAKSRRPN